MSWIQLYDVLKGVTDILGYQNGSRDINRHVDKEDKQFLMLEVSDSQNGNLVKTAMISESGLYALIFGSKLESANKFKHWVTSDILPTIHKTGGYINNESLSS